MCHQLMQASWVGGWQGGMFTHIILLWSCKCRTATDALFVPELRQQRLSARRIMEYLETAMYASNPGMFRSFKWTRQNMDLWAVQQKEIQLVKVFLAECGTRSSFQQCVFVPGCLSSLNAYRSHVECCVCWMRQGVVVVGLSRVGTRWIVARPDGPTAIPTFKRRQPVGVLQPFKILQLATCNYAKKIGISINDSCNDSYIHPFCRRKRACRVWSINSLFFHFPISCWISYMDLAIQWCVSFCDT